MKQLSFLLLTSFVLVSTLPACSSSSDDVSRKQLKTFWSQFTQAIRSSDTATLLSLCEFPMGNTLEPGGEEAITREEFLRNYYPTFFTNEEWRSMMLTSTVDNLTAEGEGRILYLVSSSEADGEIYESGLLLYFRRLENGTYKLAAMSFAG